MRVTGRHAWPGPGHLAHGGGGHHYRLATGARSMADVRTDLAGALLPMPAARQCRNFFSAAMLRGRFSLLSPRASD